MKIAILYYGQPEGLEKRIGTAIFKKGHLAENFDIRALSFDEIKDYNPNLILNRVHSLTGNEDYDSLEKTIKILEELNKDFTIVNSLQSVKADYNKHYAFKLMAENGIKVPRTDVYLNDMTLEETIKNLGGFPLVIKRNSGGRAKDLAKCGDRNALENAIGKIKEDKKYLGGILMQEFIEPSRKNYYKVWVIGDKISHCHKMSLVSKGKEKPWIASVYLGSDLLKQKEKIPKRIGKFVMKISKTIDSDLSVLDMIKTKKGYYLINYNSTPNFDLSGYERTMEFLIIDEFIGKILEKYEEER